MFDILNVGGDIMDFKKLVQYVENNKEEYFAKLIAENERKLTMIRKAKQEKKQYAHTT